MNWQTDLPLNQLRLDPLLIDLQRYKGAEFGVISTNIDGEYTLSLKQPRKYFVFYTMSGADTSYSIGSYEILNREYRCIANDGTAWSTQSGTILSVGGATATITKVGDSSLKIDIDNPSTTQLHIFYIALT